MVKESLNRASHSSKECSRELSKFSLQMIHFILGAGHPLQRHNPGSTEDDICSLTSELCMCIFRKVESSYWIWFLQGAWNSSETLLVFPRKKGNGLALPKPSPIAQAWPHPWWFICSQGLGPGSLQEDSCRKWIVPQPLAVGEVDRDTWQIKFTEYCFSARLCSMHFIYSYN